MTGPEGHYFLPNLHPGKYEVVAELASFVPDKQALDLRVGQDLTGNFAMRLGGGTRQAYSFPEPTPPRIQHRDLNF